MIQTSVLTVTGMKCGGCEQSVIDKLTAVAGVLQVSASSKEQRVSLEFDANKTTLAELTQRIHAAGFTVTQTK